MSNTNQLVRKGRERPKKKTATPVLKSGQGRKKRVAAYADAASPATGRHKVRAS